MPEPTKPQQNAPSQPQPKVTPQPVKPNGGNKVEATTKDAQVETQRFRFNLPRHMALEEVSNIQSSLAGKDYLGAMKRASRVLSEIYNPPVLRFGRRPAGGTLSGDDAKLASATYSKLQRQVDELEGSGEEITPTTVDVNDPQMTKAFNIASLIAILRIILSVIDQFQSE